MSEETARINYWKQGGGGGRWANTAPMRREEAKTMLARFPQFFPMGHIVGGQP